MSRCVTHSRLDYVGWWCGGVMVFPLNPFHSTRSLGSPTEKHPCVTPCHVPVTLFTGRSRVRTPAGAFVAFGRRSPRAGVLLVSGDTVVSRLCHVPLQVSSLFSLRFAPPFWRCCDQREPLLWIQGNSDRIRPARPGRNAPMPCTPGWSLCGGDVVGVIVFPGVS